MTDAQVKQCTIKVKAMADVRHLAIEDTDAIINNFYENLYLEDHQEAKPLLDDLTKVESNKLAEKEKELEGQKEAGRLETVVKEQTDLLSNGNGEVKGEVVDGLNGENGAVG